MTVEGAPAGAQEIERVEPGYRQVLRVHTAMLWLPLVAGAVVLDRMILAKTAAGGLLLVLVPLLALLTVVAAPGRVWQRLGFALEPAMLRVVRGWMWHSDTLVPLTRVQHLDIARGPLDRLFGTASLVIHTAGTHNSTVTLPGLSPDRAAEMAAVIRAQIQAEPDAA